MKFNREKWNAERIKIEQAIRDLKRRIRKEPRAETAFKQGPQGYGYYPTGRMVCQGSYEDYQALAAWKMDATWLYTRRALIRNRLHAARTVTYKGDGTKVVVQHTLEEVKADQWDVTCDSYMLPDEPEVDVSSDADMPSGSFC